MIRIAMLSVLWVLTGCAAAAPPSPPASTEPAGYSAESMTGLKAHRGIALHCEQDSDCAVRNIGNCCGTYLACVRSDSRTDATAVAHECAREGLAGICGYPDIAACACVEGRCAAASTGASAEKDLE